MEKQQFLYKSPNHAANLNEMRLKDKLCDVTIIVGEKEIRAHRVVLAANLKYFDAMFSNESFQESKDGIITMESVEEADLEAFVSYAYTGEILLTDCNALNLLELANYLSQDDIKKACIEFLEKHLKVEDACRAYKLAKCAELVTLKNAARATIVKNLGDCSKSADFIEFDHESLTDIFSDAKTQPTSLQQMFFEGIMKWIMHDAKNRKVAMKNLLSCIDIAKLKSDDLLGYFYKNIAERCDEYEITKDTMFYYYASKMEKKKQELAIIVVDDRDSEFSFQLYNILKRKWSQLKKIDSNGIINSNSIVLNDKIYYLNQGTALHLQEFDPTTMKIITLSNPNILKLSTVCACSKFLYLIGGKKENSSRSNQILRFDPQIRSFQILTPMGIRRSSAAAVFYEGFLYVLGGYNDQSSMVNSVEKYDPGTKKWMTVASMKEIHCFPGVAVLDGKIYVCGGYAGGDANNSVEVYDPTENSWQQVASMNKCRYLFFVVTHEGKLWAIGGEGENTVEVYDPNKDQWHIDQEMSSGLSASYPRGGLISAACIADKM